MIFTLNEYESATNTAYNIVNEGAVPMISGPTLCKEGLFYEKSGLALNQLRSLPFDAYYAPPVRMGPFIQFSASAPMHMKATLEDVCPSTSK